MLSKPEECTGSSPSLGSSPATSPSALSCPLRSNLALESVVGRAVLKNVLRGLGVLSWFWVPQGCWSMWEIRSEGQKTKVGLQAQSQGHHTINCLEERGVERGSTRWSSLKGRERAIIIWWTLNRFKDNAGETSERRGGAHMGFSKRIDTILNWSELVVADYDNLACFADLHWGLFWTASLLGILAQGCHTREQCATCHASAKQQEQGCNCLMSRANTRLCTVGLAQGCAISDLRSDLCRTASSLGILAQGCHAHEQCDTCHATAKLQELGCNCLMSRLKNQAVHCCLVVVKPQAMHVKRIGAVLFSVAWSTVAANHNTDNSHH